MGEVTIKKDLFGKFVEITVDNSEESVAQAIIEDAYNEGLRLQKIFSFYDSSSELSALNRKRKLKVSKELLEVLSKAIEYCRLTDGQYDVSVGEAARRRKSNMQDQEISCSYKDITIDKNLILLNNPDVIVDLGSIAKGYIVDKMVNVLESNGVASGLVDGRGDIRVFGDKEHIINIQHPRDSKKHIGTVKLRNMAVATSGDYNQYAHDFDHSHLINRKEVISATAIASDLIIADLFATILCVCDKKKRESLLNPHKNLSAMTIDRNLNIGYYNNFEKYLI